MWPAGPMDNLPLSYYSSFWFLSTSLLMWPKDLCKCMQALVPILSVLLPNSFHGDLLDLCFLVKPLSLSPTGPMDIYFLQIMLLLFVMWPTGPMDNLPLSYYSSFSFLSTSFSMWPKDLRKCMQALVSIFSVLLPNSTGSMDMYFLQIMLLLFVNVTYRTYGQFATFLLLFFLVFIYLFFNVT